MAKLVLTLVLVTAAAVAGCGGPGKDSRGASGGSAEQTVAPGSRACDILTKADAEKALGRQAAKLDNSGGAAGYDICQYGYQGERIADSGNVSVTVHPVDIGSMRKGVADEGYSMDPVAGLGDEAFWSKEAGLYVGKGKRTAIYILGIGGESDTKDKTIELAKSTISRL